MTYIWTGFLLAAVLFSLFTGRGPQLTSSILEGAQSGIRATISIAGSMLLWSGLRQVMESVGLAEQLSSLFRPLLNRLFPSSKRDPKLAASLSGNFCANLLGLGNAATPMGIDAAKRLAGSSRTASPELCRLIVLNTASIQLIPTGAAALRSASGCQTPFDILPAVWLTSLCSVTVGLSVAYGLERCRSHD